MKKIVVTGTVLVGALVALSVPVAAERIKTDVAAGVTSATNRDLPPEITAAGRQQHQPHDAVGLLNVTFLSHPLCA